MSIDKYDIINVGVIRFPKRTGFIMKSLCCNCLGEKFIIDPIKAIRKCLTCGAINDPVIRLYINYIPEPTGRELSTRDDDINPFEDFKAMELMNKELFNSDGIFPIHPEIYNYWMNDNRTVKKRFKDTIKLLKRLLNAKRKD